MYNHTEPITDSHSRSPSPIREESLHIELQTQLKLTEEKQEAAAEAEEKQCENWKYYDDELNNGEEVNNDNAKVLTEEKTEGSNWYRRNDGCRHYYPVRPDSEDCAFYMKTGSCKFGYNCKFNHPIGRKYQAATEEWTEKTGQGECKYYVRAGGCLFGEACRYSHSRTPVGPLKFPVFPALQLNFLGLPIRPGERECHYYMRNGSCKYGLDCKFNHPDPITVEKNDPPASFGNGRPSSLPGLSPASVAPWSSPKIANEPDPFMPSMFPPTQVAPSQNAEQNRYQASVYPTEPTAYGYLPHQMQDDEFPERSDQPECSYFTKTGDCKFKSICKYHHPKDRNSKPLPCALSDKGLPLRPGQAVCSNYSRSGTCMFGPACIYDHPSNIHRPIEKPTTTDEAGPAESRT